MDVVAIKQILKERGITEVPICDMDARREILFDAEGHAFHEVVSNLWVDSLDDSVICVARGRAEGWKRQMADEGWACG